MIAAKLLQKVFYMFRVFNLCVVICVCVYIFPTCNTGVVNQDDLYEQGSRRRVQDAVDRPEEGGPGLIVEDNNNTGGRQRRTATKLPLHTPEWRAPCQKKKEDKESVRVRGLSD